MKFLIAYSTRHGSSEKASRLLGEALCGEVVFQNLKKRCPYNLNDFDAIIVGGSIHASVIAPRVKNFIALHKDVLLKKHLGLFLCCMDKENAQSQFDASYDQTLRSKAVAMGLFGGEFLIEKMNWFERLAVKKIAGVEQSKSEIDADAISNFASKFNDLTY